MAIGVNTNFTGSALNNLAQLQTQLTLANNQASSGKRITNASVDPSGLAIYNLLTTQAQGADTANENITDATSAINVAQGATASVQSALSQISSLAIEANNGFNSPTDNAALQTQANALVQQINQDAGSANFNGTTLATGGLTGTTPATNASATITNNDQTSAGGGVLTSASASASTTSGTFVVSIANTGAGATANVSYTDSATQQTVSVGSFSAGSSTTFNGTTLTIGNISTADAGASATVQTTAAQAGSTGGTASVQSGPNQGQTTYVTVPNATSTGLGIQNIDLSNPNSATNAEGQINAASNTLSLGQASLGAQSVALQNAANNNNVLSNNLTASASAIGDASAGQISSELNSLNTQQQISIQTLNNANNLYGYLNRFLSVSV